MDMNILYIPNAPEISQNTTSNESVGLSSTSFYELTPNKIPVIPYHLSLYFPHILGMRKPRNIKVK